MATAEHQADIAALTACIRRCAEVSRRGPGRLYAERDCAQALVASGAPADLAVACAAAARRFGECLHEVSSLPPQGGFARPGQPAGARLSAA